MKSLWHWTVRFAASPCCIEKRAVTVTTLGVVYSRARCLITPRPKKVSIGAGRYQAIF